MMKMNTKKQLILAAVMAMAISLASIAYADPTGGVVTVGASESGSGSASGTVDTTGGNVTLVNVTGTQITSNWAGFYGFITGGLQLADASSNVFYQWTVSNLTNSVVYAANGTISNWAGLQAGSQALAPAAVATSNTDGYNNTFSSTKAFQSAGLGPIASTPFTTTYQGGSSGSLETYSLADSTGDVNVWAGMAIQNTTSFKTGQQVDYQILAPAASSATTTYNFYLELP